MESASWLLQSFESGEPAVPWERLVIIVQTIQPLGLKQVVTVELSIPFCLYIFDD